MQGLYKVIDILNQLESTNSRNDKENILTKNKDNELLQKVFYYAYNPYYRYNVGKKTLEDKHDGCLTYTSEYEDVFQLLDYLRTVNINNEIKTKIHHFLTQSELQLKDLYIKILLKDLRVGVTSTTINKIWNDLIPVFDVMLAKKFDDHSKKLKGKKFIITQKMDGIRCVLIKDDGIVTLWTREGKPIEGCIEILEEAEYLPDNMVYDGELLKVNTENLPSKDLFTATKKITGSKGEKRNLEFHMFEILPLDEFKKGKSKKGCHDRKLDLMEILLQHEYKYLINVDILYYGNDMSEIDSCLKIALENNQEGIMVNFADALYECKRSDRLLKVKVMKTMDLRVVGFKLGDGKFENTLGKLDVEYKNNTVGVGTGFSDSLRDEIWNNQDKYIGKIAEIQYFEESKNEKTGLPSLRFTRFKEFRFDKTEPSYD